MEKMPPVKITSGFWSDRLAVNTSRAILHQWQQLLDSGCIENFRLAAGETQGFRQGWFFADSDAYKWLDAASRLWASTHDSHLGDLMDAFIALLARAQMPDGYLFTYNQLHFPATRWHNLQIEHELYCHGHLIEAGVSHFQATGRSDLLALARRAADRIVADFRGKPPACTPGHQEIEIALLRLHAATPGDEAYLALARQFIEQRGRIPGFPLLMLRQFISAQKRGRTVRQQKQAYLAAHPAGHPFQVPPGNPSRQPLTSRLRWYLSALGGRYNQQHAPVRLQHVPVGHAVRFAYLQTAVAMLARETNDASLLPALERSWQRMVSRRMYLTGGIGSQPGLEGFGRDDELHPEYAYAETCAALGSLFWNWEMALLTGEAPHSDLFEWQLYNAALVGMGLDGCTYFYNNPLASRGAVTRRPWYAVPCCPSNLSRTLGDLGRYIYSSQPAALTVHQYISSELVDALPGVHLKMESSLPWQGRARLTLTALPDPEVTIYLRRPSWAARMTVTINGEKSAELYANDPDPRRAPSSGFDPRLATFLPLHHPWSPIDVIDIDFDMPLQVRRLPARVRGYHRRVAVTRGPLVYCLESVDNPSLDLFSLRLDPASLAPLQQPHLLGGIVTVQGRTTDGLPLTFIPYFLWGNRGPSQMTVFVRL
jgi:DUF1680 family protein